MLLRKSLSPSPEVIRQIEARMRPTLVQKWFGRSKSAQREHDVLRAELDHGVEELFVRPSEVAIHEERAGGPFIFLEAEGHVLVLIGDWMYLSDVVKPSGIDFEQGWPAAVRITRSPGTGHVFSVDIVEATPIPLQRVAPTLSYFAESRIFCGTIGDLVSALRAPEDNLPISSIAAR
jgi:hypothetical protein